MRAKPASNQPSDPNRRGWRTGGKVSACSKDIAMQFEPVSLQDAWLITTKRYEDERGYFVQLWDETECARHGLPTRLALLNSSYNRKRGTLRGMHFQNPPHAQAKVVRCVRGAIYDVIIDLRPESPTYLRWEGVTLTADNGAMLYVPAGFAHGFQTLEPDTEIMYQVDAPYAPQAEGGVRYDDAAFRIAWPLEVTSISEKDLRWPPYAGNQQLSAGS
jgi:dTDP-4-dehydrorhamnose 3,5-epimerase